MRARVPVRPLPKPDRHAATLGAELAVLCGIGGKLMENNCYHLTRLRLQDDFGTVDLSVSARRIGRQLLSDKLCHRDALPSPGTQQLVCPCHRLNAAFERRREIGHRAARIQRVRNYSADGCERIFDAMVEFGVQRALMLFCTFAFSHVDVDASHSLRASIFTIRNRTASLDPSDLSG